MYRAPTNNLSSIVDIDLAASLRGPAGRGQHVGTMIYQQETVANATLSETRGILARDGHELAPPPLYDLVDISRTRWHYRVAHGSSADTT
jgi:hypothetical protein